MTNEQLHNYINVRNGELCRDELLTVLDITTQPQINHICYEDGKWNMWSDTGEYFTFKKRNW